LGAIEEIPNVLGKVVGSLRKKRGAGNNTRAHLEQMRDVVDTALREKRWPPGAPTERWEQAWSQNNPTLSGQMKGDAFAAVEAVYGLADDFKRGLRPGERDFDSTAQHPGDDERFFLRYRAALDDALRATRRGDH
jgi:hypothetical protein